MTAVGRFFHAVAVTKDNRVVPPALSLIVTATLSCMHLVTLNLSPLWSELLGKEIRRSRMDNGDRLSDLAQRSGISPQYLSEIERGLKDPSSEMVDAIAGALGMSTLDLAKSVVERNTPHNTTTMLVAA